MEHANVDLLYEEIRRLHADVREIKHALIPEEEISGKERQELRAAFREIEAGKGVAWKPSRK